MEKTFLMKVVQIRLHCDKCGAEMKEVGTSMGAYLTINYSYECPECGETHYSTTHYPYTDYIPTNTPVIVNKN